MVTPTGSDGMITAGDVQRAARILQDWYPSPEKAAHYTIIPCCADFDHFDTRKVSSARIAALRAALGFAREDPVLLYLGSIGPDYLVEEMMQLFREMLHLRSNARFLFVSNNGQERIEAVRQTMGIPEASVRFVTSSRDDVPAYLALSNLSVFFYRADLSRAGCSPTKLAELMAANIPVIGNTGVGDLDDILSLERNGSVVVRDFAPATLRTALEAVMSLSDARRLSIRDANRAYSLEEGTARYAAVYERLLGPPADTRHAPVTEKVPPC